jgi:hypothetical protein
VRVTAVRSGGIVAVERRFTKEGAAGVAGDPLDDLAAAAATEMSAASAAGARASTRRDGYVWDVEIDRDGRQVRGTVAEEHAGPALTALLAHLRR